jgi:hypothetical protein
MGDVGNFFFGGSKQKQSQQNSSESASSQQSQNSSAQASASNANNFQQAGSQGYNQGYAPISAAMSPALGYTTQAGDMMGALLGLQPNTFQYNPTTFNPGPVMPSAPASAPASSVPSVSQILDLIKPAATAPTPAPVTLPTTSPVTSPSAPAPRTGFIGALLNSIGGGGGNRGKFLPQARELGGPVKAGDSYIVGEKRPELFVPKQDGVILPQVPGQQTMSATATAPTPTPTTVSTQVNPAVNPASALDTFSNNAGINFIRDQGQKAIAGASAGNGVFNSGATGKALLTYGQNLGSTFLDQMFKHLGSYGQLGLGAASALTGAGGVNQSQSVGGGNSSSVSGGTSQGTSTGLSYGESQGTGSGSGSSKKGLLPTLLGS